MQFAPVVVMMMWLRRACVPPVPLLLPANNSLNRVGVLALVLSIGCSGAPDRPADDSAAAPSGARLVVGSSLDQWNLLLVPTGGGTASLRDLRNPGLVLWESSVRLPASTAVVTTADGITALQRADGAVFRYEPRSDALTRVGSVTGGGSWTIADRHLLYTSQVDSTLLQVSRDGNWRYKIGQSIEWASVVEDGGVAVLVRDREKRELWLLRRGESEPAGKVELPLSPPGVITAWGRRVALMSGDDSSPVLQFIAVPELTQAGSEELDSPATAMVASPSSHEVYVAVGEGRLLSVNRLTGSVQTLARFDAPIDEMRPATLGGYLLVRSGGRAFRVNLDGEIREVDTEWTTDIPLGLPDGRVLAGSAADVVLVSPEDESRISVLAIDGPAHWTLVSWNPAPPVVAGRVDGVPLPGEAEGEDSPVRDPDQNRRVSVADGDTPPPASDLIPSERLLGFYTIVASARSYPGVLSLTQSLSAAGYPTAIQTHQDDGGVVWYRGLVGPYVNRQGADAAARQLRRERGLQVWVTEIGTGFPAEEAVN